MNLSRAYRYTLVSLLLTSQCLFSKLKLSTAKTVATTVTCTDTKDNSCTNMDFFKEAPFVSPRIMIEGQVHAIQSEDESGTESWSINGCCSSQSIGLMPQMSTEQSQLILDNAVKGWSNGQGEWTQMTLAQRIECVEAFVEELMTQREEIIRVLMWEIGKNYPDAKSEFDRTVEFIRKTIEAIKSTEDYNVGSTFKKIGSDTNVFIRRNGFGVILCLGPYNYPLNETYATLIPALLMGNVLILKIPQVGGLSHLLTFEAFAKALPPNTIHFISGSGRKTLPPLMNSGQIDGLAFIGGTSSADKLITQHPQPHRLKLFLQLEAKNMAIILKDLVVKDTENDTDQEYTLAKAVDEIIVGSLSYNGQRCTALKIIFVPKGYGLMVSKMLASRVENMNIGLPWDMYNDTNAQGSSLYSQITPLPNEGRIKFMQDLIKDATSKGAKIMNQNGGNIVSSSYKGNDAYSTENLMVPAVLFPITSGMEIYKEEQFGPLVPVVEYDDLSEVLNYATEGIYGQQVSIFTHGRDTDDAAVLVDAFSPLFGKININSQCGRSPDNVPFTARKNSGLGVMSIEDALKEFSIPTVVSFKDGKDANISKTVDTIQKKSNFMASL